MTDDMSLELARLAGAGLNCSQILLHLGLALQGKDNIDLLRSMAGLGHGMGFCGETCGTLTGGACLIGLYAGRGLASDFTEEEHPRFNLMVSELVAWFRETACAGYPGIRCADILGESGRPDLVLCGSLVEGVYRKVLELLQENGIDPTEPRVARAARAGG